MRNPLIALGLALAGPVSLAAPMPQAFAQDAIKVERVTFKPGQSSAMIVRTIRGREIIDFVVSARKGQKLVASLKSNNTSAYFNIIAPRETDTAFYIGSMGSPLNSFAGAVPESGDLKFRVYLYRAAARRGERATIRLSIAISGQGATASHLPGDALVPGTHYHATGRVSCMARSNGPVGNCRFGVIRLGSGSASVTITRLDGHTRTIIYHRGVPVGFDQRPGDTGRLRWTRKGDQTTVQIGGERYYIPDAVVHGG